MFKLYLGVVGMYNENFFPLNNVISPYEEMIAYETLWAEQGASLKTIHEKLNLTNLLPSQALYEKNDFFYTHDNSEIKDYLTTKKGSFSIMVKGNAEYPNSLLKAKYPLNLFYYKGDIGLVDSPCISVVGARKCSLEGSKRAQRIAFLLVENGYTVVSGLAEGIDTEAMRTALKYNGRLIGVIGTPIDEYYPKPNRDLQEIVASKHLLISQVPFYRYKVQPFQSKRIYFTERNVTMAALSQATIIVEASDTSGTLIQARACIDQGRKLFILNSCFENKSLKWPEKYLEKGAIRVKNIEEIMLELEGL